MRVISKLILISILLILIALSGCEKDVYYDLTEDEKKALLYYTYDKGDTFDLLRNNTDTIKFKVKEKELNYHAMGIYARNKHCQVYDLGCESMNGQRGYYIWAVKSLEGNGLHLDLSFNFGMIILDTISKHYDEKIIDNVLYQDVYLFERVGSSYGTDNYVDSGYTSPSKGIIKLWNDSVSYSLIE